MNATTAWIVLLALATPVSTARDTGQSDPSATEPAPADTAGAPVEASAPFLGGFLRETRILYPLKSGEWQAVNEHRYDDPALGVSVRYAHGADKDRWIDLYFYPAGVLDRAQLDDAAESERNSILALDGRPGAYDRLDVGALQRFDFDSADKDKTARKGYAMDMRYEREGKAYSSAMTFLLDRLYFVKARMSAEEARMSRRTVRDTLERFTAKLAPMLAFTSSGGCWMPLPIDGLAADAPKPDGASISMGLDPASPTAFLVRDRVLARDPAEPVAKEVMLLGMAQRGRLFPGCVSAEPTNPVVPEGMREIRIEYHAPSDAGSPASGRPLRRTRVGVG